MKKFFTIGFLLIIMAILSTVAVWYLLQGSLPSDSDQSTNIDDVDTEVPKNTSSVSQSSYTTEVDPVVVTEVELSDAQKNLAKSFGYDSDTLQITQGMIDCAEGKLGKARVDEISAGDDPSFLEAASLVGCLNAE